MRILPCLMKSVHARAFSSHGSIFTGCAVHLSQFPELCHHLKSYLPQSLPVLTWVNLRVQQAEQRLHIPFKPYKCLVNKWPQPTIVMCISIFPSLASFVNYTMLCLWSNADEADMLDFVFSANAIHTFMTNDDKSACSFHYVMDSQAESLIRRLRACRKRANSKNRYLFWMADQDQQLLFKSDTIIRPPDGYMLDHLHPHEASLVFDTWSIKEYGTMDDIVTRIKYLPNICLRRELDNQLACFMMVHNEIGFLSHLYTMPNERGKGLARTVETLLTKNLIAKNMTLMKCIAKSNSNGLKVAEFLPWRRADFDVCIIDVFNE